MSILDSLDPDQRRAATIVRGPLLIVAGPGTGKTRTLTHRIAHLVENEGAYPEECLAITFTRRAAEEMRERLNCLLADEHDPAMVRTFHGFCYELLGDHTKMTRLDADFEVATTRQCIEVLSEDLGIENPERTLNRLRNSSGDEPDGSLRKLRTDFREALIERGLIDFDGLLDETLDLLNSRSEVLQSLRERFRWVSVDEYQDLNEKQYRLVRFLAPEESNLCVIGDPDQAIYGFRGGDVEYFKQFESDYPSARTVELTRNYRSTPTIVQGALDVAGPETLVPDRTLQSQRTLDEPIRVNESPTARAEAEFVVKTIERMIGGTTFFSFDSRRVSNEDPDPLAFSDIGVLYRTSEQAEVLEEALSRSGIPFRKHSHVPIAERPQVEFLLNRLEKDSADPLTLRLENAQEEWTDKNEANQDSTRIYEALRSLADSSEDLAEFRSQLALGLDVDLWDPRAGGVSLLTLHASKGLEFRIVFVVGCEEELLPLNWGDDDTGSHPEERRLFFVGMTRAEDKLILSYANRRKRHGSMREMEPSRYLEEIDESLKNKTTLDEKVLESEGNKAGPDQQLSLID